MSDSPESKLLKALQRRLSGDAELSILDEGFQTEVSEFITTGIPTLDWAIRTSGNGGGIPVSKVTEISGPEVVGKTILLFNILANAQKMGGYAIFLDAEYGADREFAKKMGRIDPPESKHRMWYAKVRTMEGMWNAVKALVEEISGFEEDPLICIGLDALAALPTIAESEANFDVNTRIAGSAALIRRAIKSLLDMIATKRVAFVFINHEIADIKTGFSTTWGGGAPRFLSSLRLKLRRSGTIKGDDSATGMNVRATVLKNRFDVEGRKSEYTINFTGPYPGIDGKLAVIEYLQAKGYFGSSKGWYEWAGKKHRESDILQMARSDETVYAKWEQDAFDLFRKVGCIDSDG